MKDLVSVVVPVYNAHQHLNECVQSILKQEIKLELILVDDGSTDGTDELCRTMEMEHPDTVRYFHKNNGGVSSARNYGISKSHGSYITFVDSDDILPDGALARLLEKFRSNQNIDAVFGNHAYYYEHAILPRKPRVKSGIYSLDMLSEKLIDDGTVTGILFGSVCGAMYKRNIIQDYNVRFFDDIIRNEDGIFNLNYIEKAQKICVLDMPEVYCYRQWKKNEKKMRLCSDSELDKATQKLKMLYAACDFIPNFDVQMRRRKASTIFWNALRIRKSNASYAETRKYLKSLLLCETNGFDSLDYKSMNYGKRICCFFLKHKLYFLYFFVIKYVFPKLEGRIRR